MIGTIALGDSVSKSSDILGQVYEYFLGQFALAEGKKGGQFYTPRSVVQLLVEMLEPYEGRVFDPCCGSGGMFVQSEKFVEAHRDPYNGKSREIDKLFERVISIYGQESNQTTWRLCKMNLAIRGIDSTNVLWNSEGSFLNDAHPDLKADFVIANPPFNDSDWSGELLGMTVAGSMVCRRYPMQTMRGFNTFYIIFRREVQPVLLWQKVPFHQRQTVREKFVKTLLRRHL